MARYKLSPQAKRQMSDIWRSIAVHDERAADKLLQKLFGKFEQVANHPHMGPARPEIAKAARPIIEGNYIAIYEPAPFGVEIVAVVYARRDPAHWLEYSLKPPASRPP